jgi:hypothetical protein
MTRPETETEREGKGVIEREGEREGERQREGERERESMCVDGKK